MSSTTSDASTKIGSDSSTIVEEEKRLSRRAFDRAQRTATSQDILLFLVAFRIVNALSIRTFFQPDEFFQSLEPAWQIAFGRDSGAWITWEWKHQLRSAIHPTIFAASYWLAANLSQLLRLTPDWHAGFIIAAPKTTQAVFAALGDFYTWKLGEKVYGHGSNEAWAALILTVCSPWQWFCSTRTLSNCLETTLTIVALNYWPWHWAVDKEGDEHEDGYGLRKDQDEEGHDEELSKICRCLLLAALACVLRPTNILIWICHAVFMLWRTTTFGWLVPFRRPEAPIWIHISGFTSGPATSKERAILVIEAGLCGALILASSTIVDRLYYQQWTFPPFRFLYFNIAQSLSVFYGRNPWHYYLTQGYPLLLTTILPFGIFGLYQSLQPPSSSTKPRISLLSAKILHQLATTALLVPITLSLIAHKEVRFIYPLLPSLHILSARPFTAFFHPTITSSAPTLHPRRLALLFLALSSLALAFFSTTLHQTAPLSVLTYLRSEYTTHYLSQPPSTSALQPAPSVMTVGFLMPCHSTPWRSHLVFPGIKGWALGCEPPVGLNGSERSAYVDEADRFYLDPVGFLSAEIGKPPQAQRRSLWGFGRGGDADAFPAASAGIGSANGTIEVTPWDGGQGKKMWTEYIAFFAQLEPTMRGVLRSSVYRECWRGWNSWAHDDWRRTGDVVVWCARRRGRGKESRKGREREKVRSGRWW